ncbi:MAG: GntR family transcriptional regulator [Planctomycetota bacterium]
MDWTTDPTLSTTPSRQIVDKVLDALARGELGAGDSLPSVRKMAGLALVNHNTVARAYRELEVLGAVQGQNGRGVFVTDAGPAVAARERSASTLEAARQALEEALRAGHDPQSLRALLDHLAAAQGSPETPVQGPGPARKTA